MSGKLYPVGIQNFESLRKDSYFYVDKTELMYRLVKTGRYYFLSRPRRFGKSLLISTLEAYFQGKKELFEGLAVYGLEKEWKRYPVIHLDLNAKKFDTEEDLIRLIDRQLLVYEALYGSVPTDKTVDDRFVSLIRNAATKTGERVVILVDEYDKPILQAIGNDSLQTEYRNTLKAFYGVLKSMDGYIRFALLTGVTKFGKVSVFSDLNNLEDISRNPDYSDICDKDVPSPNTAYGISKLHAEEYLRSLPDFPYVILRPTGVYGPREHDYFLMMKSINRHLDMAAGFKRQDLTFVYVTDLVQAAYAALEKPTVRKSFFISDGNVYDSRTFSDLIRKELGSPWTIRFVCPLFLLRFISLIAENAARLSKKPGTLNSDKYRIMKQRNWRCDITPATKELEYSPRVTLEEGVKKTIAWYKKEGWL